MNNVIGSVQMGQAMDLIVAVLCNFLCQWIGVGIHFNLGMAPQH